MGYKIQKIYVGTHLVWPSSPTPPTPYTPNADTIAYFPLNSTYTYTDQSGNSLQATNYNVTFGTNYGVDCGLFDTTTRIIINSSLTVPTSATFLCRCYLQSRKTNYDQKIFDVRSGSNYFIPYYYCGGFGGGAYNGYGIFTQSDHYIYNDMAQKWVLLYVVRDGTSVDYGYMWTTPASATCSMVSGAITDTTATIGNEHNSTTDRHFIGGLSELILESRQWTLQEIETYYNNTKSTYGL